MAKLYVYQTPKLLVPAFRIPDEWLEEWGEVGFENVFKFRVPAPSPVKPFTQQDDVLLVWPDVTVRLEKAYRNEVPVPHVVLLGGGRWLLGHPEVKELEHAHLSPV